jgi:hypothetical protein
MLFFNILYLLTAGHKKMLAIQGKRKEGRKRGKKGGWEERR